MDYINLLQKEQLRKDIADFKVGDTVQAKIKVIEGGKERVQAFEGICIERKGSSTAEVFTLRKIAVHGIGVERTIPLHSPRLVDIKVTKKGRVRRAKLFYLREKVGKKARVKEETS
ncbi:MAG: 50S ribosomal protein L19 [Armatimonadota bacterium]